MRISLSAAVLVAGLAVSAVASTGELDQAADAQLGRRLYQGGLTADGAPVGAVLQGDVPVSGGQFACARCHRASGMGSSEGGVYVPPITAHHLFASRKMSRELRNERFKELFMEAQPHGFWSDVRMPRVRPAYDGVSLRRAIVDGVDPGGRPLAKIMPRYELGDDDARNLVAYLRTLSAAPDPGVDATRIRLATVVAKGVAPERRDAFLATARAFVGWMNTDTANDLARGDFSPYYRTEFKDAYRRWDLDVWELGDEPARWPAELEAYYREAPVFAVVSGLVPGPWEPVARFCDARRVPCLFPNTLLPYVQEGGVQEGGYTVYFSRGLALEGRGLARWLEADGAPAGRVLQIHVASEAGRVPAAALGDAAREAGTGIDLRSREVEASRLGEAVRAAAAEQGVDTLVIWPGGATADAVAAINAADAAGPRVVLSSTALRAVRDDLSPALEHRVWVVSPYAAEAAPHPRRFRVRAWMRSRRLKIVDWPMQSQTFYAFTVLQYGLEHLLTDFHRDYLLEIIEHEAENDLNPGIYPALALGPGQRFASKGVHLMQLHADRRRGFVPHGRWIVPW